MLNVILIRAFHSISRGDWDNVQLHHQINSHVCGIKRSAAWTE